MNLVFLDTETTGLKPEEGHRIIEVAAISCSRRRLSEDDKTFQKYCNPNRAIDLEAKEKHGIDEEFLEDKPLFENIAGDLQEFLRDGHLIAHNAEFDISFLNAEFERCNMPPVDKVAADITCSMEHARSKVRDIGRYRLEDLCRHFGIDDSARTNHSATLDTRLLARVYFAMTQEQASLDMTTAPAGIPDLPAAPIRVQAASEEEKKAHEAFLNQMEKETKVAPLWRAS